MKKRRRSASAVAVAGSIASIILLSSTSALAHEIRGVGKYRFTVGFGVEPAYLDQKNFVQLFLRDRATGEPITDLGDSLKVAAEFGSQSIRLALEPSFDKDTGLGTPGEYDAFFFPTAPGKYTFRFIGSIAGQRIDESFPSGPTTFSEVVDPASVEFPVREPTIGQVAGLATQLEHRLVVRVEDASDEAGSAKTLGLIGIIVGALGLLAAAGAIPARRRRDRA
jgi:hypothetical protein